MLLILAGISIATLTGENGILTKANTAKEEHKIAQYREELNLIILEEVTERKVSKKEEPMIESLDQKIKKKDWVEKTSKEQAEGASEEYLIVESKEGYEFIIEVNKEKETAKIIQESKTPGEKYTITYDPNGGEGQPETVEVRKGFNKILKNNTFTKEDYAFVGWCEKKVPDAETKPYLEGSKYQPKGNVTLYAIWSYNAATITFDANTGTGNMENKKVIKGQDSTLPVNTFTKEDYEFEKWNTKADGTGKDYENSATINITEDITLYAIWKSKPITAETIKKNPSSFYGSIVRNYSAKTVNGKDYNNAVANWKIFYADDNNIYLIADDYIHYDYCPPSATKTIKRNSDYKLSFNNVISDYPNGSAHITEARIKALNNDYFRKGYSSTNESMKAAAYILDTNVWRGYAGTHADYAIGGSTIEMLMKSYSEKHKVDFRAQASSNVGYQLSDDGGVTWEDYYRTMLDREDSLYVLNTTTKTSGMWLGSTSVHGATYIMYVGYNSDVFYTTPRNTNNGFRPLVCLNSDVQLEKNSDGMYEIKEN